MAIVWTSVVFAGAGFVPLLLRSASQLLGRDSVSQPQGTCTRRADMRQAGDPCLLAGTAHPPEHSHWV